MPASPAPAPPPSAFRRGLPVVVFTGTAAMLIFMIAFVRLAINSLSELGPSTGIPTTQIFRLLCIAGAAALPYLVAVYGLARRRRWGRLFGSAVALASMWAMLCVLSEVLIATCSGALSHSNASLIGLAGGGALLFAASLLCLAGPKMAQHYELSGDRPLWRESNWRTRSLNSAATFSLASVFWLGITLIRAPTVHSIFPQVSAATALTLVLTGIALSWRGLSVGLLLTLIGNLLTLAAFVSESQDPAFARIGTLTSTVMASLPALISFTLISLAIARPLWRFLRSSDQ